jgi:hypothetical protein
MAISRQDWCQNSNSFWTQENPRLFLRSVPQPGRTHLNFSNGQENHKNRLEQVIFMTEQPRKMEKALLK